MATQRQKNRKKASGNIFLKFFFFLTGSKKGGKKTLSSILSGCKGSGRHLTKAPFETPCLGEEVEGVDEAGIGQWDNKPQYCQIQLFN